MKRSRRVAMFAVACALLAPAEAAFAWGDRAARAQPRGMIATCLRDAGAPDRVSLVGPRVGRAFATTILAVGRDGATPDGTLLPGPAAACFEIAVAPSGGAVAAGYAAGRLRAFVRPPGGSFGRPVRLGTPRVFPFAIAVAASDGGIVVAWAQIESRGGRFPPGRARRRLMAARGSAVSGLGRPEALTPWRAVGFDFEHDIDAIVEPGGRTTIAWASQLPGRGDRFGSTLVEQATADPGAAFGRARVVARLGDGLAPTVSLARAADGYQLLAGGDGDVLDVLERPPGVADFARVGRFFDRRGSGAGDAVAAVRPGGGGLVAWRVGNSSPVDPDAGVRVVRRAGPGAFSAPEDVVPPPRPTDLGTSVVVFGGDDLERPPFDLGNTHLRAALGDDGRALLSWIAMRAPRHGDRPLAATVSEGSLESGFGRPRRLGSRCRAANAAVPLIGASGPLVAWTDNVTRSVVRPPEEELPVAAGRLHVSAPDVQAESGVAAPRVRVRVPPGQRLRAGDPLEVRARCDGPCDLRVSARRGRRGPVTAVGSARLGDAREHTLRLRRGFGGRIVRPGGGPMSVTARACAPGGTRSRTATARARVAARPVAPPPEPIGARALRRGREIAVRWETRRPAHAHFEVAGLKRPGARSDPRVSEFLNGRGRLRFRAALRLRPGDEVGWVRVTAMAARPPYPRRSVTVPVRTAPG